MQFFEVLLWYCCRCLSILMSIFRCEFRLPAAILSVTYYSYLLWIKFGHITIIVWNKKAELPVWKYQKIELQQLITTKLFVFTLTTIHYLPFLIFLYYLVLHFQHHMLCMTSFMKWFRIYWRILLRNISKYFFTLELILS